MKNDSSLREFKPALRFLLFFVGVYLSGNIAYGVYVELYRPSPDPATVWVTRQTAFLLSQFDGPVESTISATEPIVLLKKIDLSSQEHKTVIRVFEGCNGLNVMIVFASYVIAFGGKTKKIVIFLLLGCIVLHIANILRIVLLYETALHRPMFFYYFHKYFFTAVLYIVVFGLWIKWSQTNPKKSGPVKA